MRAELSPTSAESLFATTARERLFVIDWDHPTTLAEWVRSGPSQIDHETAQSWADLFTTTNDDEKDMK